jgi:hypothetical protein
MRFLTLLVLLATTPATAQSLTGGAPPDMSGYATTQSMNAALAGFATTQALNDAIVAAQAASTTKQSSIPASGPGAGLCRQTIVPSDLVTSGGMTGTAGTCSRILQCGTSAAYVVTQFNVGSGC